MLRAARARRSSRCRGSRRARAIVNVTSDAAVEPYEGWGGYGSSKAALEQLTAILGAEQPELRVYAVDPGDMRTQMHQDAFPGEDISDRPPPEESVPGLLALIEGTLPSGRYRARELAGGARMSALAIAGRRRARGPRAARGARRRAATTSRMLVADAPRRRARARALRASCRDFLEPGDLLVVNTSATLPAALAARARRARRSSCASRRPRRAPATHWVVELRTRGGRAASAGRRRRRLDLRGGARARAASRRYAGSDRLVGRPARRSARPLARLPRPPRPPDPLRLRAASRGRSTPTRPSSRASPGSAEMPSAGRPFTAELVTELVARGVLVAPITLHTGVSSPERGEPPYPERYRVPGGDRAARQRRRTAGAVA